MENFATEPKKGQEKQAEKGQMTLDILDSLTTAKDFVNSYQSEEKERISGKEYLDNLAKEKEKQRREEAIKAQQKISGGGNPASLGS